MNKKTFFFIVVFTCISLFIHLYKISIIPPHINADEAAFGYNAYSIIETGKDEYGKSFPLRFFSFGENKLPVMGYFMIPFVKIFGLNSISIRLVTLLIGVSSPLLLYLLTKELINDEKTALIASFLTSLSPWIHTLSRNAHEGVVSFFFIILAFIFFLKFIKNPRFYLFSLFTLFNALALFSHHIAKPFSIFFLIWLSLFCFKKRSVLAYRKLALIFIIFFIPIFFFALTEYSNPTNRINNLFYLSGQGFSSQLFELNAEHHNRIIHNKLVESAIYLSNQYLTYLSPTFLVIKGDSDPRFGLKGISPISAIEYFFFLLGLYYLFKLKHEKRFLVLCILLISILTASTTWLDSSLTRSFFLIVPLIVIISYGAHNFHFSLKNQMGGRFVIFCLFIAYLFFTFYSWDFYFNHYPKRALVVRAWQSGYKELVDYIKKNYDRFDNFYITDSYGQPYIFILFYLQYPPEKYQTQATLTTADKYGFGKIKKFDKFIFNFTDPNEAINSVVIGFPDNYTSLKDFKTSINKNKIKKIKKGTEEIFWIYENPSSK